MAKIDALMCSRVCETPHRGGNEVDRVLAVRTGFVRSNAKERA